MAVFYSSLTSCFPGILLTYFLNDFEIVPVDPIVTGITFVLLLLLLLIEIGLSPGGSGYFTYIQQMKQVTNKFKS